MEPEDISKTNSDAERKGFSTEMNKAVSQQTLPWLHTQITWGNFWKTLTLRSYLRKPDSVVYSGTQAGFLKSFVEM